MGDMEDKAVILEVISILLIAVLAYLLSGLFTRPMKHLASEIDKIQEGNLEVDLSANGGYLEVTQIANSISKVLKRLQALDQSRQEFVSNVSHELKTPITSIRVLADSLMCQENAPVELYREFMEIFPMKLTGSLRLSMICWNWCVWIKAPRSSI